MISRTVLAVWNIVYCIIQRLFSWYIGIRKNYKTDATPCNDKFLQLKCSVQNVDSRFTVSFSCNSSAVLKYLYTYKFNHRFNHALFKSSKVLHSNVFCNNFRSLHQETFMAIADKFHCSIFKWQFVQKWRTKFRVSSFVAEFQVQVDFLHFQTFYINVIKFESLESFLVVISGTKNGFFFLQNTILDL